MPKFTEIGQCLKKTQSAEESVFLLNRCEYNQSINQSINTVFLS